MEKWMIYAKKADFDGIAAKYNINPIVARIIRNRDVIGDEQMDEYLNGTIEGMHEPKLMKGINEAVKILNNKIKEAKKIRVMSDYDIDGICSAYVLVNGLKELNALIDLKIPDRVTDGYGLNTQMVEEAWDDGINTILTCDNGIAATEAIERAKELGMTVIVTDHHEVPFKDGWRGREYLLPPADVIIDPKQADCNYPFKELCGAGVAYKLLEAVYERFGRDHKEALKYLEFVGIATIGDVVNLIGENRVIVKYGLLLLNRTTNVGLSKLIEAVNLKDKTISSYHIGFTIGPCLNAAGRLETAKKAFDLLCEKDPEEAEKQAKELAELNQERKAMTEEGVEKAKQELMTFASYPVIVIYQPDCHESVAGIIAGRIRELCYRPTIILTKSADGVKGSGRSIEGYNMFEELSKCKSVLTKFGGHPMAAGLSLKEENIDVLRNMLNRNVNVDEDVFTKKVWIDVALPFEYASLQLAKELDILEPFGKGNEKPAFGEKNVSIVKMRILGEKQNVVKLELANAVDCRITGICFDENKEFRRYLNEKYGRQEVEKAILGRPNAIRLSIIYYPTIDDYNGVEKLQVLIKSYK